MLAEQNCQRLIGTKVYGAGEAGTHDHAFCFFVHFGFPTGLSVLPTQPRACCVGKVCCIVRCFKATRIYMQRAQ